jgi:hypothetical protein
MQDVRSTIHGDGESGRVTGMTMEARDIREDEYTFETDFDTSALTLVVDSDTASGHHITIRLTFAPGVNPFREGARR